MAFQFLHSKLGHCLARLTKHQTMCLSKKLDHHFLGPFLIMESVITCVLTGLSLALSWIHPVFHVSLLQHTSSSEIPNRLIGPTTTNGADDSDKWKSVGSLTASLTTIARVQGCSTLSVEKALTTHPMQQAWDPPDHLENMLALVKAFHKAYVTSHPPKSLGRRAIFYILLTCYIRIHL